jgi:hypothetical protein
MSETRIGPSGKTAAARTNGVILSGKLDVTRQETPMDIQDFVPVSAESLRARPVIHNGQQVGTFTAPGLNHDQI